MMRIVFVALALAGLAAAGCKSNKTSGVTPPPTYVTREAQMLMQSGQASVFVRGEVRNSIIPWSEDLRLSDALLAADYVGRNDPFSIRIVRQGKLIQVSTRRLLSGTQDPLLEAGDVVELKR